MFSDDLKNLNKGNCCKTFCEQRWFKLCISKATATDMNVHVNGYIVMKDHKSLFLKTVKLF